MVGESGTSWDTRMLVYGIPNVIKCKQQEHGVDTMAEIMSWVVWSLESLACGAWPNVGPDGRQLPGARSQRQGRLCGEYFFCIFQISAHLGVMANYLHLRTSTQTTGLSFLQGKS